MKLPRAERAIVDPPKVRDYLLSLEHPIGGAKARFFVSLQQAILTLAQMDDAELGAATPFGQKYVVRGKLEGPTGQTAMVESVWIVLVGEDVPRLVTVYPGERE